MGSGHFQNTVYNIVSPSTLEVESNGVYKKKNSIEDKLNSFVIVNLPQAREFKPESSSICLTIIKSNPWIPYVGDCKALDAYLDTKSITWIVPKFLNAFFRGISQVLFANNPLTGLIILVSLFWSDVTVGLATTAAATCAILTALVMRQDLSSIRAGLTTYNAVLVGCVTASLWYPVYNEHLTLKLWCFIIVGSILSVFVTSGFANIFSSYKFSLPCLTLPFNVVNILLFICLMPPVLPPPQSPLPNINNNAVGKINLGIELQKIDTNYSNTPFDLNELNNITVEEDEIFPTTEIPIITTTEEIKKIKPINCLEWGKVLTGIICSMGQVFAIENLLGSILIYIAVLIYSPILCLMCLFGAILSTITGLLFTPGPDYTTIYTGIWGYNGILSAAAVGGFFIAMTCHSFWTAVANVLFTVLLQHALVLIFTSMRLPVFTLPFVLSTLLFLSVSTSGDQLPRVTNISFPEMHRYEYLESLKQKKLNNQLSGQVGEEKELVLKDVRVQNNDDDIRDTITNGQDK